MLMCVVAYPFILQYYIGWQMNSICEFSCTKLDVSIILWIFRILYVKCIEDG